MGLNRLDFAIIAAYLIGITLFGLRFRKRQRTLRDYFLAGRDIPWWAISLSIVAAETSTLTIISIPGLAYDTNLTFLQVVLGYVAGRFIISFVLLPHYFRGDLYTAYELIEKRFGPNLRSLTSGLFLLTRAAAEGVRVYAVSIVVSIALGTGEVASIAIITLLTLIYTFEGGLAAAMSNLSAALNSLSSSTILDLFLRFRPQTDERRRMVLSRFATVAWAIVLFSLALLSLHRAGHVVEVGLQIASISYGALLGVFLLGVLTRRATELGAAIGMLCGFAVEVYLWKFTSVPWTWWVAIGTAGTFAVGLSASCVLHSHVKRRPGPAE